MTDDDGGGGGGGGGDRVPLSISFEVEINLLREKWASEVS